MAQCHETMSKVIAELDEKEVARKAKDDNKAAA
jgi:hypothetical protein